MNGNSLAGISEAQLAKHLRTADALIARAEWSPLATKPAAAGNLYQTRLASAGRTTPVASLQESLKEVRKGDTLLNMTEHKVLFTIRRGVQAAFAIAEEYRVSAGLESISPANLTGDKKVEVLEKMRTAAAISLWTFCGYVLHEFAPDAEEAPADHVQVHETSFDDPDTALRCLIFYLCLNVKQPQVNNDKALVSTLVTYVRKYLDEIEQRMQTFSHLGSFASTSFGLEDTDFTVQFFERPETHTASVEFTPTRMDEIVGNADAKHFAWRLSQRLLCFNTEARRNVFVDLGGFMPVWMGFGKPGGGKSKLIAAISTIIKERCEHLELPYLLHPLPEDLIDSFQGKSARHMVSWMAPMQTPDRIIFASIDDAENNLEERTRQGVSEGVRAVIGVFLRRTEGAYAVNYGHSSIGIFTNIPEQIDRAVRSRIQGRMLIEGAKTVQDCLDQAQLWWSKYSIEPGFVNLRDPAWYEYQSAQRIIANVGEAAQTRDVPANARMREIFEAVHKEHALDTHEFFARWQVAVMEQYADFSSRDIRNIYAAADLRVMDFELPKEWFEDRAAFHGKSYEEQLEMVTELRRANMGTLEFGDILRQEHVRYLDAFAEIADMEFEREVTARMKEYRIRDEAAARLGAKV